jgi:hypothetical protein
MASSPHWDLPEQMLYFPLRPKSSVPLPESHRQIGKRIPNKLPPRSSCRFVSCNTSIYRFRNGIRLIGVGHDDYATIEVRLPATHFENFILHIAKYVTMSLLSENKGVVSGFKI